MSLSKKFEKLKNQTKTNTNTRTVEIAGVKFKLGTLTVEEDIFFRTQLGGISEEAGLASMLTTRMIILALAIKGIDDYSFEGVPPEGMIDVGDQNPDGTPKKHERYTYLWKNLSTLDEILIEKLFEHLAALIEKTEKNITSLIKYDIRDTPELPDLKDAG